MNITSLLTKEDAEVANNESRFYTRFFGRRTKKSDGIIDAEIVGLAKWKKVAASYILHLEKFLSAINPGSWMILLIGFVIGAVSKISSYGYRDNPTWIEVLVGVLSRGISLALIGLLIAYLVWEVTQGWKWLSNWSKRIKEEDNASQRR
jgi:hypothetical protein